MATHGQPGTVDSLDTRTKGVAAHTGKEAATKGTPDHLTMRIGVQAVSTNTRETVKVMSSKVQTLHMTSTEPRMVTQLTSTEARMTSTEPRVTQLTSTEARVSQ